MAGRKSDFTLPTLDDLFSTQELRDDAKLSKIRDIPLELIDDFPDHPFKVRDDEDMLKVLLSRRKSCPLERDTLLSRYRLPTAMSSMKRPCTSMSRRIIPQKKAGLR